MSRFFSFNAPSHPFKCDDAFLARNFREGYIFHSISFTTNELKCREGVKADRDKTFFRSVERALSDIKSLFSFLKRDFSRPKKEQFLRRFAFPHLGTPLSTSVAACRRKVVAPPCPHNISSVAPPPPGSSLPTPHP